MSSRAVVVVAWLALLLAAAGVVASEGDYAAALTLYRAGRPAQAAARLEAALERGVAPEERPAHLTLLGWCRLRAGQTDRAGEAFALAAQADPRAAEPRTGLGHVALRAGRLGEAREAFDAAIERDAGAAEAWKGLGLAWLRAGEPGRAYAALTRAAELAPRDAEAAELRDEVRQRLSVDVERRLRPAPEPGGPPRYDVRAGRGRIEVRAGEQWVPLFVTGVNLGTALPGAWPGEFPDDPALYREWFDRIGELGVEAVRLYTLHPPSLYRALREHNREHPGRRVWLVQGVWIELPEAHHFDDPAYLGGVAAEIRRVIDALHGNLELPRRPGHAWGTYDADVSDDVLAWLLGREWEPFAVEAWDRSRPGRASYVGRYVRADDATAMERWLAGICETAVAHESETYRRQRPVGFVSWPTLDPLHHPTEATAAEEARFKGEPPPAGEVYDEDRVAVDPAKLRATESFPAGLVAAYHVYPYYPDFMILDPVYGRPDASGRVRRYRAYLDELRRHHGDQPVLVAEFGLPSSRGVAHVHPEGLHHGGLNTLEQGRFVVELLEDVRGTGMAGGFVFSWIDEWFKRNWAVANREVPAERNPLWHNVMDPEQNFGLIAALPGQRGPRVVLDGAAGDWADAVVVEAGRSRRAGPLRALRLAHDEAWLYLALERRGGPIDWSREAYWIGIDTFDAERGDRRFPDPVAVGTPIGMEFLLRLEGADRGELLVDPPYRIYEGSDLRPCRSEPNDDGRFVEILSVPNRERRGRDGTRYPAVETRPGRLRYGTTDPRSPGHDSLADWYAAPDGSLIEVRIPWGLLNVTDPSSHRVVHERTQTEGPVGTAVTEGFRFHVLALHRRDDRLELAGSIPSTRRPTLDDFPPFLWPGWERPTWHLAPKPAYDLLRDHLSAPR